MKLGSALVRLPLTVDPERLRAEIEALPEGGWRPGPEAAATVRPLLAPTGEGAADGGVIHQTGELERSEYLRQVLAGLETVLGRAWLVRVEAGAEAVVHAQPDRYWAERVLVHVPISASSEIEADCGGDAAGLAGGEVWAGNGWRRHRLGNPGEKPCVLLLVGTVGSGRFWTRLEAEDGSSETIEYRAGAPISLETERSPQTVVMPPWEQEQLIALTLEGLGSAADGDPGAEELRRRLHAFGRDWHATWARHGPGQSGWPAYRRLLDQLERGIAPLEGKLRLGTGADAVEAVRETLIRPGLNLGVIESARAGGRRPRRFERPIFIVAPPRSGHGLLFEALGRSPSAWAIRRASHPIIERVDALHPGNLGWDSNRLTATDSSPQVAEQLSSAFAAEIRNREGESPPADATGLRLLEKTDKNALRVPFFNAVFPDAVFVYVHRDPRESLTEMAAAWESKRFVSYPQLPDWPGPPWSLLLTPEWRKLAGKPLAEIVAEQWAMATRVLLADLEKLPADRWCVVDYEALINDPQPEVERLCDFAGIEWDEQLPSPLPADAHAVEPPDPERRKASQAEIEAVLPRTAELAARARDWVARPPADRGQGTTTRGSPFRSSVTSTLPQVLGQLEGSLFVTTYQTGKLVCIRRTPDGINTHFRNFDMPMGLAWWGGRLAIGTRAQVFEYHNLPDVAAKIEPPGSHDACFVPRRSHYTGDVRIHDIAYAGGELWLIATRFSCLATLDDEHSFVPRWRPPFISGLAAEDRCHLNGLAVVDDEVRFVTALGESDEAGGWRENKARGGVLIDVESSETVVSGLSMPHSPRWYRDRLWILESGEGTLATVDLDSGKAETVVELPGFTRGLAFAGPVAFVGLSEVRESSTFGGLPLTGRLEERQCGVWMVNIETGKTLGFLRFDDLVQEIFDVKFLPGIRFPDLAEYGSQAVNSSFVLPPEALAEVAS